MKKVESIIYCIGVDCAWTTPLGFSYCFSNITLIIIITNIKIPLIGLSITVNLLVLSASEFIFARIVLESY